MVSCTNAIGLASGERVCSYRVNKGKIYEEKPRLIGVCGHRKDSTVYLHLYYHNGKENKYLQYVLRKSEKKQRAFLYLFIYILEEMS